MGSRVLAPEEGVSPAYAGDDFAGAAQGRIREAARWGEGVRERSLRQPLGASTPSARGAWNAGAVEGQLSRRALNLVQEWGRTASRQGFAFITSGAAATSGEADTEGHDTAQANEEAELSDHLFGPSRPRQGFQGGYPDLDVRSARRLLLDRHLRSQFLFHGLCRKIQGLLRQGPVLLQNMFDCQKSGRYQHCPIHKSAGTVHD